MEAKALQQQLKIIQDSTITEDTMIEEMMHAAHAHRDRIQQMKALPPLVMDEDRHIKIPYPKGNPVGIFTCYRYYYYFDFGLFACLLAWCVLFE